MDLLWKDIYAQGAHAYTNNYTSETTTHRATGPGSVILPVWPELTTTSDANTQLPLDFCLLKVQFSTNRQPWISQLHLHSSRDPHSLLRRLVALRDGA